MPPLWRWETHASPDGMIVALIAGSRILSQAVTHRHTNGPIDHALA